MTAPLDPLSPFAARLVAAERARPSVGADEAARIFARVGETVGVAALGVAVAASAVHASRAAKLGLTAKAAPWIVLAFAAGGGTGAAVQAIVVHPATHAVSVPPLAPPPVAVPEPPLSLPDVPSAAPLSSRAPELPSTPARSADGALAAERALIDRARTALTRGQAATALDALDEHAKSYPRGRLGEEREALAIQALAALHRQADATKRASAFRRAHPQSVFLPAIALAVGPAEKIDVGE